MPKKAVMNEAEQVGHWMERIKLGQRWRYRSSGLNDRRWTRWGRMYESEWGCEDPMTGSMPQIPSYMPVNVIFAYIRSLVPQTYFRNPKVLVTKGVEVNGVNDMDIVQAYADYLPRAIKIKKTMKRVILDAFLYGTGILKIGFGSQFVPSEDASYTGRNLEYNNKILPGLPWALRQDPRGFIVPWGTDDIDTAPWVATEVYRLTEDAKEDKNLKHRDLIKGTASPKLENESIYDKNTADPYTRFFEIHDKSTGRMIILSDGSNRFHYNEESDLAAGGFPFETVTFNESTDSFWGLSVIKAMEPQQLELNDIRTHKAAHRRREVVKFLFGMGVDDETMAQVNDASTPMAGVRVPEPKDVNVISASAPPGLDIEAQNVQEDIRLVSSHGRNQSGDVSTGRRTKHEIDIVDRNANIVNDDRRDVVGDAYSGAMLKMLSIAFERSDPELVRQITGGMWHSRPTETLPYSFGLEVNPEDARPMNTDIRRQEAMALHEIVSSSPLGNPFESLRNLISSFNEEPGHYINPEIARLVGAYLAQQQAGQQQQGQGR